MHAMFSCSLTTGALTTTCVQDPTTRKTVRGPQSTLFLIFFPERGRGWGVRWGVNFIKRIAVPQKNAIKGQPVIIDLLGGQAVSIQQDPGFWPFYWRQANHSSIEAI